MKDSNDRVNHKILLFEYLRIIFLIVSFTISISHIV